MSVINRKSLLEVGAHFGHRKDQMDPRMKNYVYGSRGGVHIIDLEKTIKLTNDAYKRIKDIALNGGSVLFVGTKKQAAEAIKSESARSGSFYVSSRWLGGTLTNQKTLRKSIDRLKELEATNFEETSLTKKEISIVTKEREKLSKNLSGIKDMNSLPSAMFVVDVSKDKIAIMEAKKLGIPVFGMVDTNVNPKLVDYPIPANDDAIRSIALILRLMADAVIKGREEGDSMDETIKESSEESSKDIKASEIEEKPKAPIKKAEVKEPTASVEKVEIKEEAKEEVKKSTAPVEKSEEVSESKDKVKE